MKNRKQIKIGHNGVLYDLNPLRHNIGKNVGKKTLVFCPEWACSTVGNAPHSHCGDHRFDSGQVHSQLTNGSEFTAVNAE